MRATSSTVPEPLWAAAFVGGAVGPLPKGGTGAFTWPASARPKPPDGARIWGTGPWQRPRPPRPALAAADIHRTRRRPKPSPPPPGEVERLADPARPPTAVRRAGAREAGAKTQAQGRTAALGVVRAWRWRPRAAGPGGPANGLRGLSGVLWWGRRGHRAGRMALGRCGPTRDGPDPAADQTTRRIRPMPGLERNVCV